MPSLQESPEWLNQLFKAEWLHRYDVRGGHVRVPHSAARQYQKADRTKVRGLDNIKNRLQKLESRTGAAEFCKCLSPKRQIEYYEDGEPSRAMRNPPPIADVCGECAKPVEVSARSDN